MKILSLLKSKKNSSGGSATTSGSVKLVGGNNTSVDGQTINPAVVNAGLINANEINSNNIQNANNITTNHLTSSAIVSETGNFVTLSSQMINAGEINATEHSTFADGITADGESIFKDIMSQTLQNAGLITTKDLEVTGSAHFFELVIDKIKAAGGSILITPADGFTITDATLGDIELDGTQYSGVPFLWFRAEDGDRTISNTWTTYDQAMCANFNEVDSAGSKIDVSNNYWWYMVGATDNDNNARNIDVITSYSYVTVPINEYSSYSYTSYTYTYTYTTAYAGARLHPIYNKNGDYVETAPCHYIALVPNVKDPNSIDLTNIDNLKAQIGNDVAMLGHNALDTNTSQDTINRRSAIYLSCYTSWLDSGLKPPLFAHYAGIDGFTLSGKRLTKFDADGGEIIGKFKVVNGNVVFDLDQYIQMQVGETGLVIEDGKIVLNAETSIVKGSLDIYDDNSGLTLYNNNGQIATQIVTRNITNIANNNFIHIGGATGTISNNNCTLLYNLGFINNGTTISINAQDSSVTNNITTTDHIAGNYTVSIIDSNDTVLISNSITNQQLQNGGCDISNYTYTGTAGQLRLKLDTTIGSHEDWKLTWSFTETVTSDAYNIIGRDGLLISKSNNRLFRIDNNISEFMTIRSNDDAIVFVPKSAGSTESPIKRLAWNGNSEFWMPYDNYDRTIRIVGIGEATNYNDREVDSNKSYYINYDEAGTYIFSVHGSSATTYNIYLPSSGSFLAIPGYKVKIVYNGWCARSGLGVAKHILYINASGSDTIMHGTSYTTNVRTNNFDVNEFIWTGDSWVDTNELT